MKIQVTSLAILALLLSGVALGMPSEKELDDVKPVVEDLMKPDMDAMKLGKKSRSDVAKSAMELCAQAESPAAKMMLARNAFTLYMRDADYASAEEALDALVAAVPDIPPSALAEILERSLYFVSTKSAPSLRARLRDAKDRAAAQSQISKLQSQLEKDPDADSVNFRLAAAYVALGDWPHALPHFAKCGVPSIAKAAEMELALENDDGAAPVAEAWWNAEPSKRDAKIVPSLHSHAAALYERALPALSGLQKVQAERRVQEVKAVAEPEQPEPQHSSSRRTAAESARFTGVKLVGHTVKQNKGVLSEFTPGSYALIDGDFIPGEAPFEIVVEFTMPVGPVEKACVFGSVGGKVNGIMPFFIIRSTLYAYMSASGAAWDISPGTPTGIQLKPTETYRIKCAWDGKEYTWSEWRGGWVVVKRLQNKTPVFGGTKLQLGTCRGLRLPFNGTIDLNKCYIKVGGKLWWEGVKGAGRTLR